MLRFLGVASAGQVDPLACARRRSLILFAYLLTLLRSEHAGRAYAAYGGIYIVASLFWLWLAESQKPEMWDVTGGEVAIAAALIILFGPRSTQVRYLDYCTEALRTATIAAASLPAPMTSAEARFRCQGRPMK
jgi:drug/metabolite transporter superfamily protein YnfA